MSISTPRAVSPVEMYIEFKSDDKRFVYYDKDQKKNIEIPLPFYVVVLDELASITGYSESLNCGFYSNEVHSTKKEPLRVKSFKGGFSKEGLYDDIKDELKSSGAKFTRSIYGVLNVSKTEKKLVNIKLQGAALNAWIDFDFKDGKHVVVFTDKFSEGKKGKTTYNIPIFDKVDITPEALEEAIKIDQETLQPFFMDKLGPQENEKDLPGKEVDGATSSTPPPGENDLPF